jgi:hypothetical protein
MMAVALHAVTFAGSAVFVEGDKGAVSVAGEEAATANSDIAPTFRASIGLGEIEGNGGAECFGRMRSAGSGNLDGERERLTRAVGGDQVAGFTDVAVAFHPRQVAVIANVLDGVVAVGTTIAAQAVFLDLATHSTAHAILLTTDLACVAGWVG